MINDDPDARSLIAIALDSFRETILPLVPAERRFTALMIANALATAERELAAGTTAEPALAAAIGGLLGETGELPVLARHLCAAIVDGRFDAAGPQAALRRVLFDLTAARLAVSNPKALAARR
ncbi:hypothetical protein AZL_b02290 (plasmid) [Azospirillum sp. B510]|uniref:DUF6285 domain-containing protein n=1 Tax=Azospirillum sp. (strain B510) TaxID=137722 RepID=UPI0001C4CC24|nr:DUF6285 domain-containing protein [Azospirillum sp. B510]BAI74892.1 hypothetical protein AZL_b02290 [Azospirillum sp. B510]